MLAYYLGRRIMNFWKKRRYTTKDLDHWEEVRDRERQKILKKKEMKKRKQQSCDHEYIQFNEYTVDGMFIDFFSCEKCGHVREILK